MGCDSEHGLFEYGVHVLGLSASLFCSIMPGLRIIDVWRWYRSPCRRGVHGREFVRLALGLRCFQSFIGLIDLADHRYFAFGLNALLHGFLLLRQQIVHLFAHRSFVRWLADFSDHRYFSFGLTAVLHGFLLLLQRTVHLFAHRTFVRWLANLSDHRYFSFGLTAVLHGFLLLHQQIVHPFAHRTFGRWLADSSAVTTLKVRTRLGSSRYLPALGDRAQDSA